MGVEGEHAGWPTVGQGSRPNPGRLAIYVIVCASIAVTAFVAIDFNGLSEWLACPHTCPSDFAPAGIHRVAPGSTGCQGPAGTLCYAVDIASGIQGLTLSGLRFNVANPVNQTVDPSGPSVPLGLGATVSALGSDGRVVGVWGVQASSWQSGANWTVPPSSDDRMTLDTGLQSNATLSSAYFYVILTGPNHGAIGFPLFCAQC